MRRATFWMLLVAGALALGCWAIRPVWDEAWSTTPTAEIVGIWGGTVVALFWFVRFAISHYLLGKPICDQPIEQAASARRSLFLLLLTVGLAQVFEIVGFAQVYRTEEAAYQNGQRTEARIEGVRPSPGAHSEHYWVRYSYADADGALHPGTYQFSVSHKTGRPEKRPAHALPGQTAEALDAIHRGRTDAALPVRYDRSFPARAWVEEPDWWNARTTFGGPIIGMLIAFQCLALFLALLHFVPAFYRHLRAGRIPWWHDLLRLVPLGCVALLLLIWGISVRLFTR